MKTTHNIIITFLKCKIAQCNKCTVSTVAH